VFAKAKGLSAGCQPSPAKIGMWIKSSQHAALLQRQCSEKVACFLTISHGWTSSNICLKQPSELAVKKQRTCCDKTAQKAQTSLQRHFSDISVKHQSRNSSNHAHSASASNDLEKF
jgi:hypothetical protein